MKKVIAIIMIVAVAVVVIFAINYVKTPQKQKSQEDDTIKVSHNLTSLPEVKVSTDGTETGTLIGYANEMNTASLRDNLSVVSADERVLQISINAETVQINKLSYEITSINEKRLIDGGEIENVGGDGKNIEAEISISSILENNSEYELTVIADTKEVGNVYYYSRLMVVADDFIANQTAFAKQFSQYTMDTTKSSELAQYMEIDSGLPNNCLGRVTLSNSFNLVAWANLVPERQDGETINLKEVCVKDNGISGTYEMKYRIEAEGNNDIVDTYDIIETITVWTYNSQNYVLAYERRMNQDWDADVNTVRNRFIDLGIQQDMDSVYRQSENGKFIVFEVNGKLWILDTSERKLINIYTIESRYRQNAKIVPVRVDDEGNVNFVVCGYSTENAHVGMNGLSACRYERKSNVINETAFLPYDRPAERMAEGVSEICYINDNVLYVMLEDRLHYVNLKTKESGVIAQNLTKGNYAINAEGNTITYTTDGSIYDADSLTVLNLTNGTDKTIEAGKSNKIKICGYTGTNLVCGITPADKITEKNGKKVFNIQKLLILDEKLNEITTYDKKDVYISDVEITDTTIRLSRIQNGEKIEDDQLIDNTAKKEVAVSQSYYEDTKKYRESALSLTYSMSASQETEVLKAPVRQINSTNVTLDYKNSENERFYVYACGELKSVEFERGDAEKAAKEKKGLVVNSEGEKLWTFEENYE